VLRGLPLSPSGEYHGGLLGLLNPYGIIVGALSLTLFLMHGALYLACKTDGALRERLSRWASGAWAAAAVLYVGVMIMTSLAAPHLYQYGFKHVLFSVLLIVLLAALVAIPWAIKAAKFPRAFLCSAVTIAAMMGLAATCLFPRLVPSRLDPAATLDIYNASSTPRTLLVMLIIALIGVPIVLVYTAWIYRTFRGKTVITEASY
jgi:cytochrome bd ubiquinol oxidase subunit II